MKYRIIASLLVIVVFLGIAAVKFGDFLDGSPSATSTESAPAPSQEDSQYKNFKIN